MNEETVVDDPCQVQLMQTEVQNEMINQDNKKKSLKTEKINIEGLITDDIESGGETPVAAEHILPQGFAEEILKLEMEMEINADIDIVVLERLIELYQLGVNHYTQQEDSKCLYFQKKVNHLMEQPNIQEALSKASHEKKERERRESVRTNNLFVATTQKQYILKTEGNDDGDGDCDEDAQNPQGDLNDPHQVHNSQVKEAEITLNCFSQEVAQVEVDTEKKKIAAEIKKKQQINLIRKKTIEENIKMHVVYGMQDSLDQSQELLKSHQKENQKLKFLVQMNLGDQVSDIKKRLENRKQGYHFRCQSLPFITESDNSYTELDVVMPLHMQTQANNDSDDCIEEDEFEDCISFKGNSKRNSLEFQQFKSGNLNIVNQLMKERNINDIIDQHFIRSSSRKSSRKSIGHIKLVSKLNQVNKPRSLSIDAYKSKNDDKQIVISPSQRQNDEDGPIRPEDLLNCINS